MVRARQFVTVPLLAALACAPLAPGSPTPAPCAATESHWIRDLLYFGRSIPGGGEVTDSAWSGFVAEVLTPAFPDGFTVTNGTGQWRDASGSVTSEATTIVTILRPRSNDGETAVLSVGEAYRVRFRQEAVLHEHAPVCVTLIDATP